MRQTCKVCGRPDKFNFHVPEKIWEAVVPPPYRNRVVCLCCFDDFARNKNINYSGVILELFFAGDQATFRFDTASAISSPDLNDNCPDVSSTGTHCKAHQL